MPEYPSKCAESGSALLSDCPLVGSSSARPLLPFFYLGVPYLCRVLVRWGSISLGARCTRPVSTYAPIYVHSAICVTWEDGKCRSRFAWRVWKSSNRVFVLDAWCANCSACLSVFVVVGRAQEATSVTQGRVVLLHGMTSVGVQGPRWELSRLEEERSEEDEWLRGEKEKKSREKELPI